MQVQLQQKGISLQIEDKPFAGGGEGNLHRVLAPSQYKNWVVKLYHKHKRGPLREQKMQYLVKHPPIDLHVQHQHPPVVWPIDLVYDGKEFLGFVMPYISGEKLEILCMPKIPKKLGKEWKRFEHNNGKEAHELRLRLCFNIATAIHQIHSTERYVLVDLKPDNIVIQANGLVSIVDTDSVEVVEDEQALFPAAMATPEYTPPEHYEQARTGTEAIEKSWDLFGLAIIFYKILFGVHPFAAAAKAPYEQAVSLDEKIRLGLFVHSPSKKEFITAIPPLHNYFDSLEQGLQELFLLCFEEGRKDPALRPLAEEWCIVFLQSIPNNKQIQEYFGKIVGSKAKRYQLRFKELFKVLNLADYPVLALENILPTPFQTSLEPIEAEPQFNKPQKNQFVKITGFSFPPLIVIGYLVVQYFFLDIPLFIYSLAVSLIFLAIFIGSYFFNKELGLKRAFNKEFRNLKQNYEQLKVATFANKKLLTEQLTKELPRPLIIKEKIDTLLTHYRCFLIELDSKILNLKEEYELKIQAVEKIYFNKSLVHPKFASIDTNKISNLQQLLTWLKSEEKIRIKAIHEAFVFNEQEPSYQQRKKSLNLTLAAAVEELQRNTTSKVAAIEAQLELEEQELYELVEEYALLKESSCYDYQINPNLCHELLSLLKSQQIHSILQVKEILYDSGSLIDVKNRVIDLKQVWKKDESILFNFSKWKKDIQTRLDEWETICIELKEQANNRIEMLESSLQVQTERLQFELDKELVFLSRQIEQQKLKAPIGQIHQEYEETTLFLNRLIEEENKEKEVLNKDYQQQYEELLELGQSSRENHQLSIQKIEKDYQQLGQELYKGELKELALTYADQVYELKNVVQNLERSHFQKWRHQNINFFRYTLNWIRRIVLYK